MTRLLWRRRQPLLRPRGFRRRKELDLGLPQPFAGKHPLHITGFYYFIVTCVILMVTFALQHKRNRSKTPVRMGMYPVL